MTAVLARRVLIVVAFFVAFAAAASACGQSEGDRCQTDADCEGDLVCNQATQSCAGGQGTGIDATVPEIIIGPDPIDAMPDADDPK